MVAEIVHIGYVSVALPCDGYLFLTNQPSSWNNWGRDSGRRRALGQNFAGRLSGDSDAGERVFMLVGNRAGGLLDSRIAFREGPVCWRVRLWKVSHRNQRLRWRSVREGLRMRSDRN